MKNMLVGLLIIIVLFGCQKKEELPVVARVDGKEITLQEFKLSYQFNPFLSRIKQPDSAKKALLKSLIAEKLIALKGQSEQEQIADFLEAYKREATIEAFWKEVIEPRIKIDDNELREAYFRSKTKKIVQYLLFTDAQEAERAAKLLDEGMSFEELAQLRGFDSQTILSDTIEFNGTLPAIEDQVFKMKPGEISQPVQEGFYYFILKVTGEKIDLFTSENDFNARLYSLRKKLKRRKMQEAMAEYLAQNVPSPPYQISKEKIKKTLQMVENAIMAEQDNLQKNEGLTADIYNSLQRMESSLLNEPIVTFYDGQTWTIRQLLKRMAFASYPLRMENRGLFRKSFLLALRNVLDDQVILNEAKKRNLQNSLYVKQQVAMWRDYLLFKKGLAQILRGKSLFDPQPVYQYLNQTASQYAIQVNTTLLDTLKIKKTDMAVLKQHFPGRIAVPVFPLLTKYRLTYEQME